ncbi:response regulator [Candidatus Woesearchaeota archaeon]|nr:response regulator [Candidatus Woesearchaeota archaeon]
MEKPFILLADDDPTTVSAIRRRLESDGFSDIFNLEDFQGGNSILAYLAMLAQRKEMPAVLVLDQIMPDKTGVQVMQEVYAMVEAGAFARPKTILLTGQASQPDLEQAIQLGVNDFIKKGHEADLVPKVRKAAKQYIHDNWLDLAFVFSIVNSDPHKMEAFFEGRYHVWQQEGWIDQNKTWLDIDGYDFHSRVLAAFETRIGESNYAGGLRTTNPIQTIPEEQRRIIEIIMKKRGYALSDANGRVAKEEVRLDVKRTYDIDTLVNMQLTLLLEELGVPFADLLKGQIGPKAEITDGKVAVYNTTTRERPCQLPIERVHDKEGELTAYRAALLVGDPSRTFEEIGRLGVLARYRGGYHGNNVNERLHQEALAYLLVRGVSDALICCDPRHWKHFYRRLGFQPVPGAKQEEYYKINAPSMAYRLDLGELRTGGESVDPQKRENILVYETKLKQQKERDGDQQISCMCPHLQDCLKSGYLSPVSQPLDYHCPLRAQRFLENKTE